MKRRKANIISIVIVIMLMIGMVAFYLYDVIVLQTPYTRHLFRTVAIVCLLLGTLFRLINGSRRRSLGIYEKVYSNELGTAFSDRPFHRKKLLCACRLYDESNYWKAIRYLQQLMQEADENDVVPVLLFMALCYADAGVDTEAIGTYDELLKRDPNHAQAHSNLGIILVKQGDFRSAINHYNQSLAIKPDNYYAYVNRANCYFRMGEFDAALTDAKQALAVKNNGMEAASLLTVIYALRKDEENKKHYYHIAITAGKKPDDLNEAIAYFSGADWCAPISKEKLLQMSKEELSALSDDELFEAVLSRIEHRVDQFENWADGVDSLNTTQKIFYSVNWLDTEVNNGGLCQFFVNSSRMVAPCISRYLGIIGADDHKLLFDSFVAANKIDLHHLSSFDVDDIDEYEKQTRRYPFDEYDDAFYEMKPLETYLQKFAREHIEDL